MISGHLPFSPSPSFRRFHSEPRRERQLPTGLAGRGRGIEPGGRARGGPGLPLPARVTSDSGHKDRGRAPPPHAAAVVASLSVHLPDEGAPAEPPCPPRFSKPEEPGSHSASPPRPGLYAYDTPAPRPSPSSSRAPGSLTCGPACRSTGTP